MRILGHSSALCMKSMDRISFIIDNLKFTIFIIETIPSFHITFIGSFFISKLSIEPKKIIKSELLHTGKVGSMVLVASGLGP